MQFHPAQQQYLVFAVYDNAAGDDFYPSKEAALAFAESMGTALNTAAEVVKQEIEAKAQEAMASGKRTKRAARASELLAFLESNQMIGRVVVEAMDRSTFNEQVSIRRPLVTFFFSALEKANADNLLNAPAQARYKPYIEQSEGLKKAMKVMDEPYRDNLVWGYVKSSEKYDTLTSWTKLGAYTHMARRWVNRHDKTNDHFPIKVIESGYAVKNSLGYGRKDVAMLVAVDCQGPNDSECTYNEHATDIAEAAAAIENAIKIHTSTAMSDEDVASARKRQTAAKVALGVLGVVGAVAAVGVVFQRLGIKLTNSNVEEATKNLKPEDSQSVNSLWSRAITYMKSAITSIFSSWTGEQGSATKSVKAAPKKSTTAKTATKAAPEATTSWIPQAARDWASSAARDWASSARRATQSAPRSTAKAAPKGVPMPSGFENAWKQYTPSAWSK